MTPQELLALAQKATPRPWEQWSHHGKVMAGPLKENTPMIARGGRGAVCECDDTDRDDDDDVNELACARDDAAYLAAAANNAPDYARRLVELEKELEATRKERDEAQDENRRMHTLLDAVGPITIVCGQ